MNVPKYSIDNKQIGILLIVISLILLFDMYSITERLLAANQVLHQSCNLPEGVCPYTSYPSQSIIGYGIVLGIFIFGLILMLLSKKTERMDKDIRKDFEKTIELLKGDEKSIYEIILQEGAIFQSDIVFKSGISKVKVTRILDKLEGRGLIERKRRGLSNVVIPKKMGS